MGLWKMFRRGRSAVQDGLVDVATDQLAGDFDLVDSMRDAAKQGGLAATDLFLSIVFDPVGNTQVEDRHVILLGNGQKLTEWQVESLRLLFRGSNQPPPDSEMAHYPEEYTPFFYRIEYNVYRYCRTMDRTPTDAEFVDLYSQMRRRPDGKSLGALHDVIWQSAAVVLGLRPWSEAEYTAVFRQLSRSARHFQIGPTSRNYMAYVRQMMEGREKYF